MNSTDFFAYEREKWNKTGIYVLEQEVLSNKIGRKIYKIWYARDSLTKRLQDYSLAYTVMVPFKIILLYEVPEKSRGQRANFALLTEQRIHKTLKEDFPNSHSGFSEWYYDLPIIMNVISSVRTEHLEQIPKVKDWVYYSTEISNKRVPIIPESAIKSTLKDLVVRTEEDLARLKRQAQPSNLKDVEKIVHSKPKPVLKAVSKPKLVVPTTFINADGDEKNIQKKRKK
eukprot:823781-Rhodomonas_salina.1